MTYKQKFGYTLLGAGIMAVGITIGQFITPDIEAQSNGVFDEIHCTGLKLVDKNGNVRIRLDANDRRSSLSLSHRNGEAAISLSVQYGLGKAIKVYNKGYEDAVTIGAINAFDNNHITVHTPAGEDAINLSSSSMGTSIRTYDDAGNTSWRVP